MRKKTIEEFNVFIIINLLLYLNIFLLNRELVMNQSIK